jgi:ribonuclease P/MRP protein subunit RPP1
VWGLGRERGFEGVGREGRSVVVQGRLKRTGYRGVVDVVEGGEKPEREEVVDGKKGEKKGEKKNEKPQQQQQGQKRKAEAEAVAHGEQPLSNRQRKKRAHEAKMLAAAQSGEGTSSEKVNGATSSTPAENGG